MCQTCNGTGGITLEHNWGLEVVPCPSSNCDFDKEAAWAETQAIIDRFRREMREAV